MIFKNSLVFFKKKIRSLYLNSKIYDKKISSFSDNSLKYKPSPNLLDCLIKYNKKKINIENYSLEEIWTEHNLIEKDYENLNSFFWLFSLDLKSSKKDTQNIISQWIKKNNSYNSKSWEIDIMAKRIISWISNSKLTYEDGEVVYRNKFNNIIKKQVNHLINEIEKEKWVDDQMIGCAAIILAGLAYGDKNFYLPAGLNLLKKIIKFSFDNSGFPKTRNIKQLIFYLKYFVLIREWLKESQNEIPQYIDENIYYLGQAYSFAWQNNKKDFLFNGNNENNNNEFDHYLKRLGYSFKNKINELGGYAVLSNKKITLVMDVGAPPDKKFSSNYQAGSLSFEIISGGKKLITNSGYFQNLKNKFNLLSKSSAAQSTLVLNDVSSCKFTKTSNSYSKISQGLKIIKKNIVFEENYWKITAEHDGYLREFGFVHKREIEFYPEQMQFIGHDKLISKNDTKNLKFEIRFHLEPSIKVMKTQDNKSILIDLNGEGWKFSSKNNRIDIDKSLYFGKQNSVLDNQHIFISGMTNIQNQTIKWELKKL
ncbi:heparinase II/III-family protein [Candidatus Pelagibacter sp.]|nr:heparinase II/III-family protein [Candidatus Pelagibacter sp.]